MKPFRTNRQELLQVLDALAPAVSPRDVLAQSSCFVFEDGWVRAFDNEVYLRAKTGLPDDVTGAVHGKPLLEALRNLPDDEVEVRTTKNDFIVSGFQDTIEVRLAAEILLPTDKVETPAGGDWHDLPPDFGESLKIVAECCSKDEHEFIATCVNVTGTHVEGSDSYQFARMTDDIAVTGQCLVRAESAKAVAGIVPLMVAETDKWLHFKAGSSLRASVRRLPEDWFSSDALLKLEGDAIVLPKGLVAAVKLADVFSAEYSNDNRVTIDLAADSLTMTGVGVSGRVVHREDRVKYRGRPASFSLPPPILTKLIEDHTEVEVAYQTVDGEEKPRLIVRSGSLFYLVVARRPVSENGKPKGDEK